MARTRRRDRQREEINLGGDFWISYSDLMTGLLLIFVFVTTAMTLNLAREGKNVKDAHERLNAIVEKNTKSLAEWDRAIRQLCTDPELMEHNARPNCETGAIELAEGAFFPFNSAELTAEGRHNLASAVPIVVRQLKEFPLLWQKLETISVIGHTDSVGSYEYNLRLSQDRARQVVEFLTSSEEIAESDRATLRGLLVAAGSSFSRPHPDCADRASPECQSRDRRVELRLDLDDNEMRKDLNGILKEVLRSQEEGLSR
jgi:chemotaxis protein MotB